MTKEAIEARREYKRQWQRANPDKVKQQQERYWQKKADEMRAKANQKAITLSIE